MKIHLQTSQAGVGFAKALYLLLVMLIIVSGIANQAKAAMSGSYSVCSSGCDYTSVSAAVTDLINKGVSGPVVINISSGTYSGTINASSAITGVSATNTVTFKGAGRGNTVLTSTGSTLGVYNSSYITFTGMTINTTGSGYINPVTMNYSTYCSFTYCDIINAASGYTFSTFGDDHCTLDHCQLQGGSIGAIIQGYNGTSSAPYGHWTITNNRVTNFTDYGIYGYNSSTYGSTGNVYSNNTVDSVVSGGSAYYGILSYYESGTVISNNRVLAAVNYPIIIYNANVYDNSNTYSVYNNFFYKFYGNCNITLPSNMSANFKFVHNTIYNTGSSNSGALFSWSGTSNFTIANNVFYSGSSSAAVVLYSPYNSFSLSSDMIDGNDYYNGGTGNLVSVSGTGYSSLSSYKSAMSSYTYTSPYTSTSASTDASATNVALSYVSVPSDIHLSSSSSSAAGLNVGITTDIYGSARSASSPMAGAVDYPAGSALNFYGSAASATSNNYVSLNNSLANFGTGDFTIQMRVRTSVGFCYLYSKRSNCSGGGSFIQVYLYSGKVNLELDDNSNNYTDVAGATAINDGNWHQISVVRKNSVAYVYIDGSLDGSASGAVANISNSAANWLGLSTCTYANGSSMFQGDMDEVRFWSRALCVTEIQNNMSCELSGTQTNLNAYYQFNQGLAGRSNSGVSSLTDASGNSITGTLNNFTLSGSSSNWVSGGISGTSCSAYTSPSMAMTGNGNSITNGATTTSTSNNTDFGNTTTSAGTSKTYTITNSGTGTLTIGTISFSGTNASDFAVTSAPASSVAASSSTSFTVTFTATAASATTESATISIANNDVCNGNNPYTFKLSGTGLTAAGALNFDGSNDYVTAPNISAMNLTNQLTMECWVYQTDNSQFRMVVNKENDWEIAMSGNTPNFAINPNWNWFSFNQSISLNTWTHLAVTYDGSSAKTYINGTLTSTRSITGNFSNNGQILTIGWRGGHSDGLFAGNIDEVRIWKRALCQGEIQNNMSCELANPTSQNGLIAYYKLNSGFINATNSTVTTATDASANNNTATLNNFSLSGSTSNWVAGKATGTCSAYSGPTMAVTGNSNSIANGATTTSTTNNTDFGSSGTGVSVTQTFTIKNTGTGTLNLSTISFSGTNASDFTVTASPASSVSSSSSTTFTVKFTPAAAGTRTATISIANDDCANNPYTFALSGTGLSAAGALNFDGSDDYIEVANATSLNNYASTGGITVEYWLNPGSISSGTQQNIIAKRPDANDAGFVFERTNDSVQYFFNTNGNWYHSTAGITQNTWQHIAVTAKIGDSIKVYVNGVKKSAAPLGGTSFASSSTVLRFMNNTMSSYPRYGKGSMDEVRFFSRALCQSEIQSSMSCEYSSNPSGLEAYYKLNQGYVNGTNTSVNTAADASGNSNTGTLKNFALSGTASNWVAGQVSGTCGTFSNAAIGLSGNSNSITNGSTTPSSANGTNLGSTAGGTLSQTFTITNTGNTSLTVSSVALSGTGSSSFSISGITTPATVAVNGSTTFTVNFSNATPATYNATVKVSNSDCNNSPFTFAISGTNTCTAPSISGQPSSATICAGSNATFSVSASGTSLTYQWQQSTNGGSTWSNLSNTGAYSNVTASTMSITGGAASMDNYQYRCVVSGACTPSATSNAATLRVNSVTAATVANQTVCSGTDAVFSVSASGTGTASLSYQWNVSTDGGSTFSAISGATAASYTVSAAAASADNNQYQCIVTSGSCTAYTSSAGTLRVNGVSAASVNSQTVCAGSDAVFSVTSTNTGTAALSYQWKVSTNGGTSFSNITGATASSFTVTSAAGTVDNFQYQCVVTSGSCAAFTSSAGTLRVNSITTITINDQTVCEGSNANFTAAVVSTGNGTLSYQWQISTDGGSTFSNITGATSSSYSASAVTASANGNKYRCMVTSGACTSFVGSPGSLTVNTLPAVSASPSSATVCSGSNTTMSVTASGTGISYQWQESQNNGSTWNNLSNTGVYSNVTTAAMSLTAVTSSMDNYQYRCVVSGTCTPSATSSAATLRVNSIVSATIANQTVCAGVDAVFSVSVNSTGPGTITYQWLENGSSISGATASSYTVSAPGAAKDGHTFVPNITIGGCSTFSIPAGKLSYNIYSTHNANGSTSQYGTYANSTSDMNAIYNTSNSNTVLKSSGTISPSVGLNWSSYSTLTSNGISIPNSGDYFAAEFIGTFIPKETGTYSFGIASDDGSDLLINGNVVTSDYGGHGIPSPTSNVGSISMVAGNSYTFRARMQEYGGGEGLIVVWKRPSQSSYTLQTDEINAQGILNVNSVTAASVNSPTVCAGANATFTVSSITSTGPGTLSYQWQLSTDAGSTYSNISAATSATYTASAVSASANGNKYRCLVTSASCTAFTSSAGTLNVNTAPAISSSPSAATACAGTNASFSVSATGTSITYQWQESQNSGSTWNNLSNTGVYSNVTTATLNLTSVTAAMNSYQYRCVVSGTCSPSATSGAAALTVNTTPVFSACPSNISANTTSTACNTSVTYAAAVSGTPTPSVSYVFTGATSGSGSGTGSGSTFNKGVTTVTISATNTCGNASSCSFTVTVTDNVKPVMLTQNKTVYLNGSGTATITTSDIDNGTTDNCGSVSLSLDKTSFTCANLGTNTVTLTATDGSSNSNSATATVTVLDTTKPVAKAKNITASLDTAGSVTITASQVNNGSSDNCGVTLSLDKTSFSCSNLGANTVTLTATDASGNSSTATATVTVKDTIAPGGGSNLASILGSAPSSILSAVPEAKNFGILYQVNIGTNQNYGTGAVTYAVDNSGKTGLKFDRVAYLLQLDNNYAWVSMDPLSTTNLTSLGVPNVTYNNTSWQQKVTNMNVYSNVSGVTTGTGITKGNVEIWSGCYAQGTTVSGIGGSSSSYDFNDQNTGSNCYGSFQIHNWGAGQTILAWNDFTGGGTDDVGIGNAPSGNPDWTFWANAGSYTTRKLYILVGSSNGVRVNNPTVYLDANGAASISVSDIDNNNKDNCSIASKSLDKTSFTCSNLGANNVTLTLTDGSGNTATGVSTVTVKDTIKPVAKAHNLTVYLNGSGAATITPSQIDNGSSDNCSVVLSLSKTSFSCANTGNNTVTLTATDPAGNTATATAVVTVLDTAKPVVRTKNITVNLNSSGTVSITPSSVDNGSTDNCTFSLSLDKTSFTCSNTGANVVKLTATDASGNTSAATATVTVIDNTAPTVKIKNITVNLDDLGYATIAPSDVDNGSSDNCSFTLSLNITSFSCVNAGNNTVTLTAKDASGNTSSATAVVTVVDNKAPVAKAKNITVYLDGSGSVTVSPYDVNNLTTDNCGFILTLSKTSFNCSNTGSNTVTLTAKDPSNNTSTATATITVLDTAKPVAKAQDLTVYLDANGSASITAAQVDNGSSDNCSVSLSLDKTSFTCTNTGANTVTLTATDPSGNKSTATATITVKDTTHPVAKAQNLTVYLDANGSASITAAGVDNGSSDNCSVTLTLDKTSFGCADAGSNTVTLTATDPSGNATTATAVITVKDTTAPVAICKTDSIILDLTGHAYLFASDINNGSHDNCSIVSYTLSDSVFTSSQVGNNSVTLTVKDAAGNSSSCTTNVYVIEPKPVARCKDATIYLDASGKATLKGSDIDNGSSSLVGSVSLAVSKASFDCSNLGGNSVALIVTNQYHKTDTCISTVTVKDTTRPVMATQDVTIYLNANGKATISPAMIDNGTSDNCSVNSLNLDKTSFSCSDLGTNTVTLTAVDESGNANSAAATVTVKDTTRPIMATQDVTIYLNANGKATISPAMIDNGTSDNCSVNAFNLDKTSFTCGNLGANTVTLTAVDESGNTNSATATVTLKDTTRPIMATQNVTVYLDANGKATINTTMIDNGTSDNCTVSSLSLDNTSFTCSNLGANTVTLTAVDESGNTNSATATVTVKDTTRPIMATQNVTVYLDAYGKTSINTSMIDNGTSDNCTVSSLSLDNSNFSCSNLGANTVTLTATDESGNVNSATAAVTVKDTTRPIMVTQDVTVYLDANGKASITTAMIDNGTSDNCTVKSLSLDKTDFTCGNLGANTVILTAADQSGNSNTATATVTVKDTIKPTVITKAVTVYLDATGKTSITCAMVNNGTFDNCTVSKLSLDNKNFTCGNLGANTVTLTAVDESGNSNSATAEVTVKDTTKPAAVAQSLTIYLDANGKASITAAQVNNGSNDNCTVASLALDNYNFTCSNTGNNTVTLTVTDQSGNSSTTTATITVKDTTKPSVITKNITVYLDANGKTSITPSSVDNGSYDNCSFTLSIDKKDFTCSNEGANTVTLTSTDASGNVSSATATVTVKDTTRPVVITKDVLITLNSSNAASISVSDINNGSYDNCTISSLTLSKTSFNCSNVGANTVVLTVTDNSGNVNTATATVTVKDPVIPVAKAKNITVYLDSTGSVTVKGKDVDNGSYDNCGIVSYTLDKSTFTCSNTGYNKVTLTVADAWGNTASTTCYIKVIDNIKPSVKLKNITAYLDNNGNVKVPASQLDNGSWDNCAYVLAYDLDGDEWSNPNDDDLYKKYDCDDIGDHKVWVFAIDKSYNYSYAQATISVKDTIKPVARVKNITVYLDNDGDASISSNDINNGSSDNCKIVSYTLSKSKFYCSDLGANTVTLTVKDASGNVSTATASVTVKDNTAPHANAKNITVYLDANGNAGISYKDVNDHSWDNCSIASMTLNDSTFTCSDLGNNTVKLTVTDGSGNISTDNATVTVKDNIKPVAKAKNLTVYLDNNGNASVNIRDINNGSYDNCGVEVAFDRPGHSYHNHVGCHHQYNCGHSHCSSYADDTLKKFDCGDLGSNTVTIYAIDASGNYSTASATVTVLDTILPVAKAKSITAYLGSNGSVTVSANDVNSGSSDNCSVNSMTLSKNSFNCSNIGSNTVTLTVKDASGNSASTTAVVTVKDNTAPYANAKDITVYLDASGQASIGVNDVNSGSSDNCGIASMTLSQTAFDCGDLGKNRVTLTVKDGSGNTSSDDFYVTVADNTAPVVKTKNITAYLDKNGQVTVLPSQVDNGSSDNCTVVTTFTNNMNSNNDIQSLTFRCSDIGAQQVFLKAGDKGNNHVTASAYVTVKDTTRPAVKTKNITVTLNNKGAATISAGDVISSMSDNCSIASYTVDKSSFSCSSVGDNMVTVTVKDPSGNTAIGYATVTVQTSLTASAGNNTTVYYGYTSAYNTASLSASGSGGSGKYSYKWSTGSTSQSISVSPTSSTTYYLTVTDGNGCTATDSVVVTVIDVHCGTGGSSVQMCHNGNTICVAQSDVAAYLKKGDKLGACTHLNPMGDKDLYGMSLSAYPNPFNENTTISFTVPATGEVTLELYNMKGQQLKTIYSGNAFMNSIYTFDLAPQYMPAGIYMVKLSTGTDVQYIKLMKTN